MFDLGCWMTKNVISLTVESDSEQYTFSVSVTHLVGKYNIILDPT